MNFSMPQTELHDTEHIGWLRASMLGVNDGLTSTSSLVVVAAAQTGRRAGAACRVGAVAMGLTAAVSRLFGTVV